MTRLNSEKLPLRSAGITFMPLSEIFEIRNGYTPSKLDTTFWNGGEVPWFRMEDIRQNGRVLSRALQDIPFRAVKGGRLFPANSILISTSATIGEHALIEVPHVSNQRFSSLVIRDKFKETLNPKFAFYYCFKLAQWCRKNTSVSSFASVNMDGFRKFKFPIPARDLQDEIVRMLDTFTSLQAELEAELEARTQQFEYYLQQLFRLDQTPRVPLGDVILENIGGGTPSKAVPDYWDGNIPWASVGDLTENSSEIVQTRNYISDLGVKNSSTNVVPSGHLVVAIKISPGKMRVAGVNLAINQDLRGIKLNATLIPKFVYFYFKTLKIVGTGTIVQGITKSQLEKIEVPVPELDVQSEIVLKLDALSSLVEEIQKELSARRKQYEYYRDQLLNFQEA